MPRSAAARNFSDPRTLIERAVVEAGGDRAGRKIA